VSVAKRRPAPFGQCHPLRIFVLHLVVSISASCPAQAKILPLTRPRFPLGTLSHELAAARATSAARLGRGKNINPSSRRDLRPSLGKPLPRSHFRFASQIEGRRSAERRNHPLSALPLLFPPPNRAALVARPAASFRGDGSASSGMRSPSGAPPRLLSQRSNALTQPRPCFTR
jgi:hypothetical protein